VGGRLNKRYYWLKLKDDFFNQKEIKRLRRMAGGDTYTIIYLKMLLLSLKNEGKLFFDNIGDDFVDELSLELDEDVDNTKMTLSYLQSKGLLEIVSDNKYHLSELPEMIGSESPSASRVRRHRKNKKEQKALQSNSDETESNKKVTTEKEIEKEIDIEREEKLTFLDNVLLKESEYNRLIDKYGKTNTDSKIEDLDTYISNKGKNPYKDHNKTIRNWMKKDNIKKKTEKDNEEKRNEMIDRLQDLIGSLELPDDYYKQMGKSINREEVQKEIDSLEQQLRINKG